MTASGLAGIWRSAVQQAASTADRVNVEKNNDCNHLDFEGRPGYF